MSDAPSAVMPVIFFGHGNPMNAIETNDYTRAWADIGRGLGRPKGVLAISAHWYIPRTAVTTNTDPPTIHDFGGFPRALFDTPFDYEAFAARDGLIGHGGVVVFDDTVDMARQARFAMEFCAIESCGKCTPCRIGSTRGVEVIDRIRAGRHREEQVVLLRDLCDTMINGSLCAMGSMTPYPVLSALDHFPQDFGLPGPSTLPSGWRVVCRRSLQSLRLMTR